MAHWYLLQKTTPLVWKKGQLDRVLHVWPCRPPPDEELRKALARQIALLFEDELMLRLQTRSRERNALGKDGERRPATPSAGKSKRRKSKRSVESGKLGA